jgi:hypothetical protein
MILTEFYTMYEAQVLPVYKGQVETPQKYVT